VTTRRGRKVRLADLIGSRVVDRDGRSVGHVVEIEVDSEYRATHVHLGRFAWLQRLHLARLAVNDPKAIAWEDVDAFEDWVVRLKRTREELWS
jgi:sporulation protein YlmC with PRC-barrel domain